MLQAASASSYVKPPETAFVKAIRSHASNCLDVRMIVPDSKSSSHWSSKLLSGYEVRRKDKDEAIGRNGKSDWEDLTLYVENIPIQHRTLPSIARFISSLLDSEQDDCTRVQSISFPRHHNDQPDSYPSIKGFAIVTLSRKSDVQLLLEEWPWDSSVERGKGSTKPHKDQNRQSPDQVDARKSGFRCLTKSRWEELKVEYLLYRQQLIEELAAEDEVQPILLPPRSSGPCLSVVKSDTATRPEERQAKPEESRLTNNIHAGSPFPSGCLVFVRHVHPETNKTTLRTLFSQAWDKASSQDAEKLDYMDYSKGLDSCYIRLSSPSHADHLVQYFIEHPTLQTSGLDAFGTPSSSGGSANNHLVPELVTGKREELYWQKVPEKIRKQAVDKALKTMQSTGSHAKGSISAGD
ncbi:hypothetical protein CPC08DRAFT_796897 [Agrocybe pediades]|nr:hypothetical protein CPC08DRAFT_796897 [Agrocybe pediades]